MEREDALRWVQISTTKGWYELVQILKDDRAAFLADLLDPLAQERSDMFAKGAIFVIDQILNAPHRADSALKEPEQDPLDTVYEDMDMDVGGTL